MAFFLKDKVGWEAAPVAQFDSGSSSDQQDSGAYRSKWFVLREDMPDGLGQLAGDVDPGNLGATPAAEAFLVPLVAVSIVRMAGGVSSCLHQGPAQVLRSVLGQRSAEVAVTRLAHDRAKARIAGELLRAREAGNVADLARDRVGEKRSHAGDSQQQRDVGVVSAEPGQLSPALIDALVQLVDHGQARGQCRCPGLGQSQAREERAAGCPEQVGDRYSVTECHERGMNAALQRAPVVDKMEPEAGPLALGADRWIGQPDLWN